MSAVERITRREFLKKAGAGFALAAAGSVLAGCAPAAGPSTSKPSGRLSMYSALNETTNNEFVKAYKAAYPGVEVDLLPLAAAGELQTRIQTEKNSPKADIFVGGSSEFHDPLGKQGLLEAYKSPNASVVDANFKEASGLWTGWSNRTPWHNEGGKGTTSKAIHFQVRPDPLAK